MQLLLSGRCVSLQYHFDTLWVCTFHWEINLAINGLINLEKYSLGVKWEYRKPIAIGDTTQLRLALARTWDSVLEL